MEEFAERQLVDVVRKYNKYFNLIEPGVMNYAGENLRLELGKIECDKRLDTLQKKLEKIILLEELIPRLEKYYQTFPYW